MVLGSQRPLSSASGASALLISRLRCPGCREEGSGEPGRYICWQVSIRACEVGSWGSNTGAASSYLCGRGRRAVVGQG